MYAADLSLKEPRVLPRVMTNASARCSLAAAGPQRSIVAENIIKPAKQRVLENPYKTNVEKKRNMEAPKK